MDDTGDDTATWSGPERDHPLSITAGILGKKWHPVLMSQLLKKGPLGFNELKTQVDGISDKVLSESLDDLQEKEIVERTVIDDKPVRVEYSLTKWGRALEPAIRAMEEWGRRYVGDADDPGEHR
ncbi:MAG: winged helix-turn-helix transcriptional regulator [Haloarculaceae archaeon]